MMRSERGASVPRSGVVGHIHLLACEVKRDATIFFDKAEILTSAGFHMISSLGHRDFAPPSCVHRMPSTLGCWQEGITAFGAVAAAVSSRTMSLRAGGSRQVK